MAPVKTIAVIIAMEAEAAPLVEHLGLKKQEASPFKGPLPAVVFSGVVGDATVHVCTNGKASGFGVDSVGTVPAALTAYNICASLEPDVLINAGTAGGFKAMGGAIGDVYLVRTKVVPFTSFRSFVSFRFFFFARRTLRRRRRLIHALPRYTRAVHTVQTLAAAGGGGGDERLENRESE